MAATASRRHGPKASVWKMREPNAIARSQVTGRKDGQLFNKPKAMNKKTHPISDGWLHLKLTMNSSEPLGYKSIDYIEGMCAAHAPENYEFAQFKQHGATIKAIYRKKKTAVAA